MRSIRRKDFCVCESRRRTCTMCNAQIEPEFIEGRRVTSEQVLDAAVKVMCGTVNHQFLSAFSATGVKACGISGLDGSCVFADRADAKLGLVGRVSRVNPALFD